MEPFKKITKTQALLSGAAILPALAGFVLATNAFHWAGSEFLSNQINLPWLTIGLYFFGLSIVVFRDHESRAWRLTSSYILGVISSYVVVFGALISGPLVSASRQEEFNSVAWIDVSGKNYRENPVRLAMVNDLKKRIKLVGMTHAQIFTLLGKPDSGSECTEEVCEVDPRLKTIC
jgi:hypothetical protein